MPKIINIDKIEDNMVLAEPVINKYKQTLIPSGAILFQRHKLLLKTWNIQTVRIKKDEMEKENDLNADLKQLSEQMLTSKMLWMPRIPVEWDLFNIGVLNTAKSISKNKT